MERALMTPISRLLSQGKGLHQRATLSVNDVNEAYLLVHHVMTRAIGRIGEQDVDLGPAMTRALQRRSLRLLNVGAAT
jgi:hypothetical protein